MGVSGPIVNKGRLNADCGRDMKFFTQSMKVVLDESPSGALVAFRDKNCAGTAIRE